VGGNGADVQIGLPVELRADIDRGLGSIQAFADTPRGRTVVLVTTTGAWSLLEPLFDYVDRLPDGRSGLDGDVLAAGPEGTVTNLSIGSDGVAPESTRDSASWPAWVAIGAGCVALVVLAVGTALWWRRRRRAGRRKPRAGATVTAAQLLDTTTTTLSPRRAAAASKALAASVIG
jgi:hypothetical protein